MWLGLLIPLELLIKSCRISLPWISCSVQCCQAMGRAGIVCSQPRRGEMCEELGFPLTVGPVVLPWAGGVAH